MDSFLQDLRHAVRVLLKNPGTTAIMVFALALGIGATTAIFTVAYGVLLRPLPYPEADRIVSIWEVSANGHHSHLADPNFDDFQVVSISRTLTKSLNTSFRVPPDSA